MMEQNSSTSTDRFLRGFAVLALAATCGCGDPSNNEEPIVINGDTNGASNGANAEPNGSTNATPNGTPNGGTNNDDTDINANCPPEARPVYVVEADELDPSAQGKLVRFDPQDQAFTEIGQLSCPAELDATPFSMSVDRDGVAWVLYSSGELFEVSTTDASCEATTFERGQSGYDVFGMGFVLNQPGNPDETLYVAGGSGPGSGLPPRIGYISFPGLTLTDVTEIAGWPEMSGTAEAELWAFFPDPVEGSARVSLLVPASGEETEQIPVDSVITGSPNAWAFAHWGGRFYLFYKSQSDPSTNVFEVRQDGSVEEIISDTGRYIVGAGVSTCAPTTIL